MLDDIAAQFIAHGIWLLQRPAQQVLKAIGRGVASHFGQLPAVLALGGTQQTPQIGERSLPRLSTFEIGRQAPLDIV
jgi:hypothetical protein